MLEDCMNLEVIEVGDEYVVVVCVNDYKLVMIKLFEDVLE